VEKGMKIHRILLTALAAGLLWCAGSVVSSDSLADLGFGASQAVLSRYELAPVKDAEVVKKVTATGTLNAVLNVEVGSQLSGQVESLFVDFNDIVHKGQVLAQLDERSFRAEVDAARATLDGVSADWRVAEAKLARAKSDAQQIASQRGVMAARADIARIASEIAMRDAQRKVQLGARGVVASTQVEDATARSDQALASKREAEANLVTHDALMQGAEGDVLRARAELDVARAAVNQHEAQLETAMINLDRTRILSPIDGVIVGRNVTQGQTLASTLETRTLFVVAGDLRRMEVYARVDESDISQIAVGQPVEFTVDSFPGRRFKASVSQIRKEPQVIQNVVTYVVVLATANEDYALLPGMTVVAKIETSRALASVTVPLEALRFRPRSEVASTKGEISDAVVWVLHGEAPTPVSVTVGAQDGERAAITSGDLHVGDRVVIRETPLGGVPLSRAQGKS
jgi:HlyD family secretion protein